jgi:hypothetical protein
VAVPRDDNTIAARLKIVEEKLRRLGVGADFATDPDDRIFDPQGELIFGADLDAGQGTLRPRLSATISTPALVVAVTSATWVEGFTVAGRQQNAAWEVRFSATCEAGTSGEVRAVLAGTSTLLHDPVAVPVGDTLTAAWTLDLPGNYDGYVVVEVQAQRTAGTGAVRVRPYSVAGG